MNYNETVLKSEILILLSNVKMSSYRAIKYYLKVQVFFKSISLQLIW